MTEINSLCNNIISREKLSQECKTNKVLNIQEDVKKDFKTKYQ